MEAHEFGERVDKLLDLIRSSLLLVTLEGANQGEAMEHIVLL